MIEDFPYSHRKWLPNLTFDPSKFMNYCRGYNTRKIIKGHII